MHRPLLVTAILLAAVARGSATDMPVYTKAPVAAAGITAELIVVIAPSFSTPAAPQNQA